MARMVVESGSLEDFLSHPTGRPTNQLVRCIRMIVAGWR
jgi:hypothetical protein